MTRIIIQLYATSHARGYVLGVIPVRKSVSMNVAGARRASEMCVLHADISKTVSLGKRLIYYFDMTILTIIQLAIR